MGPPVAEPDGADRTWDAGLDALVTLLRDTLGRARRAVIDLITGGPDR
jgi:hypothetical protein